MEICLVIDDDEEPSALVRLDEVQTVVLLEHPGTGATRHLTPTDARGLAEAIRTSVETSNPRPDIAPPGTFFIPFLPMGASRPMGMTVEIDSPGTARVSFTFSDVHVAVSVANCLDAAATFANRAQTSDWDVEAAAVEAALMADDLGARLAP